jgi:hypothetical protein
MENKQMRRCSTSQVVREMKIKPTMGCLYISIRITKVQNSDINDDDMEQ